jgi:hypothetical protein
MRLRRENQKRNDAPRIIGGNVMEINGKNIRLVRGDSDSITVQLSEGDTARPLVTGDIVYFTVKKSPYESAKVFQKIITEFVDGKAIIPITHDDTKDMEFKSYVYDIQITFADGTVKTIVPPSQFEIMPEVTYE